MARKTQTVVIDDQESRDFGKTYVLTEMAARQSEWWAMRCLTALCSSDVDMPEELINAGMSGIASLGVRFILGTLGKPEMKPLHDEMLESCVTFIPDPKAPNVTRGFGSAFPLIPDDIEEQQTLRLLRQKILGMHMDFFPPAVRSILDVIAATAIKNTTAILTSQPQSE